jgi:hypothetical protein
MREKGVSFQFQPSFFVELFVDEVESVFAVESLLSLVSAFFSFLSALLVPVAPPSVDDFFA